MSKDAKPAASSFEIFTGKGKAEGAAKPAIPTAPPWRRFQPGGRSGKAFVVNDDVRSTVNAALHLRRPILVTGDPGTGKSSIAYAVADELGIGPVLKWSINSRSTLKEGLYQYDAIARLQDSQQGDSNADGESQDGKSARQIGDYITLGPLGAAMLCSEPDSPSVLLIDEIDKSDIDLPNDLLHVFEDGSFDIPELLRLGEKERESVDVFIEQEVGGSRRRAVKRGVVQCQEFPFVVLTSNGERELPPAFHRRCLRLDLSLPDDQDGKDALHDFLAEVVDSHLEEYKDELHDVDGLIEEFRRLRKEEQSTLAVDQLMQAVFLLRDGVRPTDPETLSHLKLALFKDLRG